MGLISRTVRIIKAKLSVLIGAAEDPIEQLEFRYQQMQDQRRKVKSNVADVKAQRKRLEKKLDSLQSDVEKHNEQAREAMRQEREDLARKALAKKKSKMKAVEDLEAQTDEMGSVEEQMMDKLNEIETRLDELRTEKEVLKARYKGAKAMEGVNESMAEGIGDYSVEGAIGDIEEDIQQMQSRAEAINEIEEEQESVEDELEELSTDSEIESEMHTLREELGTASADSERVTEEA